MTNLAIFWWLLGIAGAHAARLVLFDDPPVRKFVAISATVVYLGAAILGLVGASTWAWAIAVLFPLVGVSTVALAGQKVDEWQAAVGVTQFALIAYIISMLIFPGFGCACGCP